MGAEAATPLPVDPVIGDDEVIKRVLEGEIELYEIIMRRYNQRLYRTIRAILGSDDDVEHVMQDAYVSAYTHVGQFASRSSFATWLTKIAIHEALATKRKRNRFVNMDYQESENGYTGMPVSNDRNPEQKLLDAELSSILEHSVEALPESFRSVFVLREIEKLDTRDTAECLGITEENVKVRLHRARALIRGELSARMGTVLPEVFRFHLSRCDRIVAAVFGRIAG